MRKGIIPILISVFALSACSVPQVPTQSTAFQNSYSSNSFFRKQNKFVLNNVNKLTVTRDGTVYIKNVPFTKQGNDNTCGQAVMTSILRYWGVNTDYQTVVNETNPLNIGTNLEIITEYLNNKGLNVTNYKQASIEYLHYLINQGRPAIVLLDFGGLMNEHYVIVTGYNSQKGTIVLNDSVKGQNLVFDEDSFIEMWKNKSLANMIIFGDKFDRPVFDISSP